MILTSRKIISLLLVYIAFTLFPCYAQENIAPKLALQIKNNTIEDAFFSKDGKQFLTQTNNTIFIWDSASNGILDYIPNDVPDFKKNVQDNPLMKLFSYEITEKENYDESSNKRYKLIKKENVSLYHIDQTSQWKSIIIKTDYQENIGSINGTFRLGTIFDHKYKLYGDFLYIWDSCGNANIFNFIQIRDKTLNSNDIYKSCKNYAESLNFDAGILIIIDLLNGDIYKVFDSKTGIRGIDFVSHEKIIFNDNDEDHIIVNLADHSRVSLKPWFDKYSSKLNNNESDFYYNKIEDFTLVDVDQFGKHALFTINATIGQQIAASSPASLFDGSPIFALDLEKMPPPPSKSEVLNSKILMICPNNQLILKVFSNEYDSINNPDETTIVEYDKHERYFFMDIDNPEKMTPVLNESGRIFAISPNCENFFGFIGQDGLGFFSLKTKKIIKKFIYNKKIDFEYLDGINIHAVYSNQGDKIAIQLSQSLIAETYLIDTKTYTEIAIAETKGDKSRQNIKATSINFSSDGSYLQVCEGRTEVNIFDIRNNKQPLKKLSLSYNSNYCSMGGASLAGMYIMKNTEFDSSSGKSITTNSLININSKSSILNWAGDIRDRMFIFSKDARYLFLDSPNGIEIRDGKNGALIHGFDNKDGIAKSMFTSADDKLLVTTHENGVLAFWDINSQDKRILARMAFGKDNWLVTAPDGRFDTNVLDNIPQAHWIMPDDPLTPLSPEIFMRDYYEPRLLQRILACTQTTRQKPDSKACISEFPTLPVLANLNRAQPELEIVAIELDKTQKNQASVKLKVKQTERSIGNGNQQKIWRSGICDIRLFRDGQIVGSHGAEHLDEATTSTNTELDTWRQSNCLQNLDANGESIITFAGIQIPQRKEIQQVTFSAYAFNQDRVKSATVYQDYQLSSERQPIKRRAYIITIGVEHFEYEKWNLDFAADDAREMQKRLQASLHKTGEFDHANIIPITLIAEKNSETGEVIAQATKDNIHSIFQILAGKVSDTLALSTLKAAIGEEVFNQLKTATPDDFLLIAYSSHGYADSDGGFYLFPHDIGTAETNENLSNTQLTSILKQRAISSDELSNWLQGVDAGELTLIIDACYSEAGIAQSGFKPAPMGSKGLGQLSYDKRMRVLTAASKNSWAYEINGYGVLTAALAVDGLGDRPLADFEPEDQRIELGEWLRYGVKRVPELLAKPGKAKDPARTHSDNEDTQGKSIQQQPALFDFRNAATKDIPIAFIQ